jgi:hypothetical protein
MREVGSQLVTEALTQPRRIRYSKIALARNTFELPWPSRTRLLERVAKDSGGLKLRLAFEAVGATRAVILDAEAKRILLQVIDAWLAEPSYAPIPKGIRELRAELQNEVTTAEERAVSGSSRRRARPN